MPRTAGAAPGGLVYHVLNRAVARLPLFRKEADYAAFGRVLLEASVRTPTRLLAWCIMRNHWRLVIWPRKDGELTAFVR
jgi:putative transposase